VWTNHCKDDKAFKKVEQVRSKTILEEMLPRRNNFSQLSGCPTSVDQPSQGRQGLYDHLKKVERHQKDLEAHNIAKKNHPRPELNSRGEPQWHGSAAQNLLKATVEAGQHKEVDPKELWNKTPECRVHTLELFRDHVCQEGRLHKFNHCVDLLKKKKIDELQH
jgi:hypothetical protein